MSNINIDIIGLIFKRYGYKLSAPEYNQVIDWYRENYRTFTDEHDADRKLQEFLSTKFPNRMLFLFEEDTSNISYLLTLLAKSAETK